MRAKYVCKKINEDWKFWKLKDSFALFSTIPESAEIVTLPHDAMLYEPADEKSHNGGNTGYRDGDIYIYSKQFYVMKEDKEKTLMLKFEGVYMNAFVYINGHFAGKNPYGYSGFYVILNDFLHYGTQNEIRVQARAGAMPNSRWYSGAGIYRDVYLYEAGLTYIVPDGIQIMTKEADQDYALLEINTEIKNRMYIPGKYILETCIKNRDGMIAEKTESLIELFGEEERKISQRILIEKPMLWTAETPNLYDCETRIIDSESKHILDQGRECFGIRTLQVDAKRGFRVNGSCIKLRGACIHHDSGLLGAATYEEAQFRQIWKLKQAGFNAVRMSHHPMAPAMLRACDCIGMYVLDETFDMWNQCKSDYDYALYFQEWWEQDVTSMVRKDFNHPSVILYSVGNEIPEIGSGHGAKVCHHICEKIRSLDPVRFTLASINGIFAAGDDISKIIKDIAHGDGNTWEIGNVNEFMTLQENYLDEIVTHDLIGEKLEMACAAADIVGYNYMTARYESDGKRYPQRVIVGSETYPPEIHRNWKLVEKYPHLIGDFTWTGWDYIGEAGIGIPGYHTGEGGFGAVYPAQLAYCGDMDITGFRRPLSYYREIVFGLRREPYIAVQNPYGYGKELMKTPWVMSDTVSSWNWHGYEEQPVIVEVYSPGDQVELFLNENCLERKNKDISEIRTLFHTVYRPGVLKAVSYENGNRIGEAILQTADAEHRIDLKQEPGYMDKAEEGMLKYINVEICDINGVLASDDDQKLCVSVEGGAELAGFGSADPKPIYNFTDNVTETYQGRALIILKKTESEAVIRVMSESGMNAELIIS